MNNPARLSFPFLPTRLEHESVNISARHGFSCLVLAFTGLALLSGCKTQWDHWDDDYLRSGYSKEQTLAYEQSITRLRPGQTSLAEVERALGPFVKLKTPHLEADGAQWRRWRDDWRGWSFVFTKEGVLQSFSRNMHGNMGDVGSEAEWKEFQRWYQDRLAFLPVQPERVSEFVTATTTQEDVARAWGVCMSAQALGTGGFAMRWGSNLDAWTLVFDAWGVLASEPRHYVSGSPGK